MLNKYLVFMIVLISTIGLSSATVSISGIVSESSIGLDNVGIDIGASSTTTNASGYYIISGLAENTTHTVIATIPGYEIGSLDVVVTTNNINNANIIVNKIGWAIIEFCDKIAECVNSITAMFSSIMSLFMEPPLIIFVAIGLFGIIIGYVSKYMKGMH